MFGCNMFNFASKSASNSFFVVGGVVSDHGLWLQINYLFEAMGKGPIIV